jgi:enamine deaminase RidA (YjgF/YER057c/UK114 family)
VAGGSGDEESAGSAYGNLREALASHGARPEDVVAEKVFVADALAQSSVVEAVRGRFYAAGPAGKPRLPASSIVQQPPLDPPSDCEVKAFALLDHRGAPLPMRPIDDLPSGILGRVVDLGSLRLVHLSGITGGPSERGANAEEQAASMFIRAQALLLREGLTFHDVFRTWIYLPEIDRDYAALNRARRAFFRSLGVDPPPASTGIQGTPPSPTALCSMDLRAAAGLTPSAVRAIHAPTLNEAPVYGSDFSRGMRVDLGDRTLIHISGTASIDEHGEIVHPGSIERQAARMFENVERLLDGQRAGYEDLVTLTTYLKRPEYLEPFVRVAESRGLSGEVPHTICLAGVCRPGWLCEMEGLAALA